MSRSGPSGGEAGAEPRLVALRNLAAVLDGRSLDAVLPETTDTLPEQSRSRARQLSYELCRWHRQLHAIVAARLHRPLRDRDRDIHLLLMLGVYQLMHARMPPHAAISSAVELSRALDKPWASKLVNGLLRGVQREQGQADSPLRAQLRDPSIRFAQPKWFVRAMQQAWPERYEAVLAALQTRAPMTLRLDTRRESREAYLQRLRDADIPAEALRAVPDAVVLARPMEVHRVPGFDEGRVSVQDAGAQLAARLLGPAPGQRILDACAAPGGKTGHLLELAGDAEVTAMDVDAARLRRVADNLRRLGRRATLVEGDASRPPAAWRGAFDRILLDAPCSATGVMRRHPDVRLLRRRQDIGRLAARQAAILSALWPCLRPGGRLLYATCSLMPQENEQQIESFLQQRPDARSISLPDHWGHARIQGRQTLPGEQTMDGFYYALLEKRTE